MGVKLTMNIKRAMRASNFLFVSKEMSSFNAGGCPIPMKNIMKKAMNNHEVPAPGTKYGIIKEMERRNATAIKLAYLCFSLNTPLAICPPSSCPAGSKLMAVTSKPTHPANAVG